MKSCPYCNNPIQENWTYCRNCNKPLIVNLENVVNGKVRFAYDESETYQLDLDEENDDYDTVIIKDEEIDKKIKKIDETTGT